MRNVIAACAVLALSACATSKAPELTPLELQALQTREFEASKEVAFSSVMSVFQDLGYTVESANKDTGFITAFSASDSHHDWLLTGNKYTSQTRATAFVEPVGEKMSRIRLNFVTGVESSAWYGQHSKKDKPILDPAVYQAAFEKIESALFIRS